MSDNGKTGVEVDVQRLYQALGTAIRERRRHSGFTQEELAAAMGVSRTSVVNLEAGRQHPPLATLYKVAATLGIGLEVLLPSVDDVAHLEIETEHGRLPPKAAAVLQEVEEVDDGHRNDECGEDGAGDS